MDNEQRTRLIEAAKQAQRNAYAKYSEFPVGASVLTDAGEIFDGCNVENASFGLTICAERVAIASAIAAGHRAFQALALVTNGAMTPCGACRQFMSEFCDDLVIVMVDAGDESRQEEVRLRELLPRSFRKP